MPSATPRPDEVCILRFACEVEVTVRQADLPVVKQYPEIALQVASQGRMLAARFVSALPVIDAEFTEIS